MSRSYRHHLVRKQGSGTSWKRHAKGQANRRVRRHAGDLSDGKSYRKLFDPWTICDWIWRYDSQSHVYWWGPNGPEVIPPDPLWKWRWK